MGLVSFFSSSPLTQLYLLTSRSWYAVYEFLLMEVFSEHDRLFGFAVYLWVAIHITTSRRYYD